MQIVLCDSSLELDFGSVTQFSVHNILADEQFFWFGKTGINKGHLFSVV